MKNITKPLENLSAIKLKRVSKAFLLAMGEWKLKKEEENLNQMPSKQTYIKKVFNKFYETHRVSFNGSDSEAFDKLLKVKKDLFADLKLDEELLSDEYFSE